MGVKPLRVQVSGELTRQKVDDLVAPFVTGAAQGERVLLDLGNVEWTPPFGLVSLISLLDHFHATAKRVRIICPTRDNVRQYLAYSGFLQQLPKEIETVGDGGLRLSQPTGKDTVVTVTRLEEEGDIANALQHVGSRLDAMLGTGDEKWTRTKGAVVNTIGELCENILQHADCKVGWVGAQQYFNRFKERHWVEIGIADAGRGIRSSLATAYPEMTDLSEGRVIERAVRDELSRLATADRPRGAGFHVLKMATRQYDGLFYLRSGAGAVHRGRRAEVMECLDGATPWPGTHLGIGISCG